jgi:hypothetical protein
MIKTLLQQDLDLLTNPNQVTAKVKALLSLFQSTTENSQLVLASLLRIHFDKCQEDLCACRRRHTLHDPMTMKPITKDSSLQMHQDAVFVKHYLLNLLKKGLKRFPCKMLHLHYLYYSFEILRLTPVVYLSLQTFMSKYGDNLSLTQQLLVYRLRL